MTTHSHFMSKNNPEPKIGIACELLGLEGGPVKRCSPGLSRIHRRPSVYANNEVAVVSTGIRKAFASAAVRHLIETYPSIRDLIHIGFAGSLDGKKFPKGKVLLGRSVRTCEPDAKKIELEESMKILEEVRAETAAIVSVDQFITGKTDPALLAELREQGDVVDMEACLTAQTCLEHKVTPHVLKLVSDVIREGRSGIWQALGLPGALLTRKNMDPVFSEMLTAIQEYRRT